MQLCLVHQTASHLPEGGGRAAERHHAPFHDEGVCHSRRAAGYVTANETLLREIRLQRMPWSVNQMAINAGHYLLMHQDEYVLDIDCLIEERERMHRKLSALGVIDVWPSDTNIMLCKLRFGNARSLKDYLAREHGILIRDASNFSGLDQTYFRIAVQTPEEDDALVNAIIEWLAQ